MTKTKEEATLSFKEQLLKDWNSVNEPTKLADIKPLVRKGTSGYNQRVFMITTEGEKHT